MTAPPAVASSGQEACELAAMAGLVLDPWQQMVLQHALGEREDGKWSAFEVGLVVSRQNGKGAVLEARMLAGLYLLKERLIIFSSHLFDTSLEAFRRLLFLVENTPELDSRVRRVSRSHGEEGIELKGGQRVRFRTRTKGGGRGFTADCLILDEAMFLPEATVGALLPTLSARPNPQVWYTGSSVDQFIHDDGVVLARVRQRGHVGDPSLAYFEWSLPHMAPGHVSLDELSDRESWRQANPGFGLRISPEHIANEARSMDHRTFVVERLGVGDWPDPDSGVRSVIQIETWMALTDPVSAMKDPVVLAFDVAPDRSMATVAAAGVRDDGLAHVEVIDYRRGTGWVVGRIEELVGKHAPSMVVCDGSGPAASLMLELERLGIEITPVTGKEHSMACGLLFDAVEQGKLRHLGSNELASAVRGAVKRPLGDAWAWSRRTSSVDISPLVAVTLAHWAHVTSPEEIPFQGPLVAFG
jgi:hypothetical protein